LLIFRLDFANSRFISIYNIRSGLNANSDKSV
ncbi:MAG: hypothetical protein ACI90A_000073, partial [Shewanella sp.]